MGREFGGEWIHMAESLHCSPQTRTTLIINYTPIQNEKLNKVEKKKTKPKSIPLHLGLNPNFLPNFFLPLSSPLTHLTLLQFWYLLSVSHTGHACSYLRPFAFDVLQSIALSSKLHIADFLSCVIHSSNVHSLGTSSLHTQTKMASLPGSPSIL